MRFRNRAPSLVTGYGGGYTNINQCTECDIVSHHFDQSHHDPCVSCGGKVKKKGAAVWVDPEYKWQFGWPLRVKVKNGYWNIKRVS